MEDVQHKELIEILIRLSGENLKRAYQYAKQYPNEEFAQPIIEKFEASQPKEVEHTQSGYIKLTHNNQIQEEDCGFRYLSRRTKDVSCI
ncbi:MAG: hypothetical protein IPJ74_08840 [Saprospiraceae bacterium]|nr:hypothetical protein [Saprospiraceae bacterium]